MLHAPGLAPAVVGRLTAGPEPDGRHWCESRARGPSGYRVRRRERSRGGCRAANGRGRVRPGVDPPYRSRADPAVRDGSRAGVVDVGTRRRGAGTLPGASTVAMAVADRVVRVVDAWPCCRRHELTRVSRRVAHGATAGDPADLVRAGAGRTGAPAAGVADLRAGSWYVRCLPAQCGCGAVRLRAARPTPA